MLIELGVTCAWIAMSAVGAGVLVLLGSFGGTPIAANVDDSLELWAHEDLYPHESLSVVAGRWR